MFLSFQMLNFNSQAVILFLSYLPFSVANADRNLDDFFTARQNNETEINKPYALKTDGCQLEIRQAWKLGYIITHVDIREFATDPDLVQTNTIKSYGPVFSKKFSMVWYLKNPETVKKFRDLEFNQLNGRISNFHHNRSVEELSELSSRINKQFNKLENGELGLEVQRNYSASYRLGGKVFEKIRANKNDLEPLLMYVTPTSAFGLTVRKESDVKELVATMNQFSEACDSQ